DRRQEPSGRCRVGRLAVRDDLPGRARRERARAEGVRRRAAGGRDHRRGGVRPRSAKPLAGEADFMIGVLFVMQTLRIAVPYLFAAMGGVISERAGMIALSLEGFMLTGAFCAALGAYYTGGAWGGVAAGIAGGVAMASLYAVACVRFRADQVVVGIAINLMAIGATRFFLRLAFDSAA